MSVQPVQVHTMEAVSSQASRPAVESAPAASHLETPRDSVTVSDQARQLAAAASGGQSAPEAPRLQLDFRQLRELAFKAAKAEQSQSAEKK